MSMSTVESTADLQVGRDNVRAAAERRGRWRSFAGLAPIILWQIVFFVVPLALLGIYSFWRLINYRVDYTFTLYNYREIFSNPLLLDALLLSLQVAVVVTVVCAVLAYPIAYFIAKKAGRWRTLLLILVIVPFWTSFILRAYAWKLLLGERGFINSGLMMLGTLEEPISYLLYSPIATSIGLIYAFLPFYILPLYTSIDKVQDSWLAAAQDLGATPMRTFFEVTFPLCVPGLVVGAVFTFIFAVGDYVIPQLLGGGKSLLIAQAIVLEFETSQNWPGGAALSMVLLVIILAILAATLRWIRMEDVV
jgi:ABC-type spermidine/putrescine transport system permease subunit I